MLRTSVKTTKAKAKKNTPASKATTKNKKSANPTKSPKRKLVTTEDSIAKMIKVPAQETSPQSMEFVSPEGKRIKISVEFITPQIADEMLQKNLKNRKANKRTIKNLVKRMKKDHWMFNGDAIRFSERTSVDVNGQLIETELLIDGQHRLMSIVESGKPQQCLVIRGLHPDAFATIDEGVKRSASTTLDIEGVTSHTKKAGIAKTIALFNNGYYGSIKGGGDQSATPENIEVLDLVRNNNEKLDEAIEVATETKKGFPHVDFKILAAMYLIFGKHGKKEARAFYNQLAMGKKAENDAVRTFCAELIKNSNKETKLPYNTILVYFIKTWNAFKSGETLGKLSYDKDTEEFPKPL